jgi:hypothetical protein
MGSTGAGAGAGTESDTEDLESTFCCRYEDCDDAGYEGLYRDPEG